MQIRADDHKALVDAVRGVLGLLKERDLLRDPRVVVLTKQLDRENEISRIRSLRNERDGKRELSI